MKINYRGLSYEYNPPKVEYGDLAQSGKYRGLDIRFRNPQKAPVMQATLDLVYRGVAYTNAPKTADAIQADATQSEVTQTETVKAPARSVQARARVLMMDHHRQVKQRQQSMLSRSDARVGLPTGEASRFWNHIQGAAHPSFGDSYDRSGAAFS